MSYITQRYYGDKLGVDFSEMRETRERLEENVKKLDQAISASEESK